MVVFILFATLLVAVSLAVVLKPLLIKPKAVLVHGNKEMNISVMKEQQAELDREKQIGILGEEAYQETMMELRRRVLEEVPTEIDTSPKQTKGGQPAARKTAVHLALFIPLTAVFGYLLLGNTVALNPMATAQPSKMTPEQIQEMVQNLSEKLKTDPSNVDGWIILGRSYKTMGRIPEAVEAYDKAESSMAEDPDFLTDYADLIASTNGGRLVGKPISLIRKALQIDPDHVVALWLAGTAAYNQRNWADAVLLWERARKVLPDESEDGQMLLSSIDDAKRRMDTKRRVGKFVSGRVELSPKLQGKASVDASVFIFARAIDGSRMPLAVNKIRVSDLPYDFVLDDQTSMMSGRVISGQTMVVVEARISMSGDVMPKQGDLGSKSVKAKVGASKLRLVIDNEIK